jgi:hypothetical protein
MKSILDEEHEEHSSRRCHDEPKLSERQHSGGAMLEGWI